MALLRRKNNPEGRMSLGEHLREFRRRAVVAAIAIVIGGVIGWLKYDPIIHWLEGPLRHVQQASGRGANDVNINYGNGGVSESFSIKMKVSIWAGLLLSCPVWLWQIWAFLAPGLTKREKRIGVLFIGSAVPLFALGCWVSTFAINNAVSFLMGSVPPGAINYTDANKYITFVTKFIMAFGLAFLLPVFLMGLNRIRVLPGRVMLTGWRVAVMAIFVFAAAMSPSPDAWSMLALAFPMVALYYLACGLAIVLDRRGRKQDAASRSEWLDLPDDQRSTI